MNNKLNNYSKVIAMAIFVLLSLSLRSQHILPDKQFIGTPFIKNFHPKDYLANFQNWDAVEDDRGILYIANNHGVLEYDGQEWRLIPLENNAIAFSLAIDQNQVIYVGGINEFGKLIIDQTGTIKYHSLMPLLPAKYCDFSRIIKTVAANNGVYFISNPYIFFYSDNQIRIISELNGDKLNLRQAYSIENKIYIRHKTNGLFALNILHLDKINGTEIFNDQDCGLSEILLIDDNSLLIITEHQGLYKVDITLDSRQSMSAKIIKIKSELETILTQANLYTAERLSPHLYAVGTSKNGIILINVDGDVITIINKKSGLQNNMVNSIFIDSRQNMWALLNIGLSFIELNSTITKIAATSQFGDLITSMHNYNNSIFIGAFDGIYCFPSANFSGQLPINKIANCSSACFDFLNYHEQLLAGGDHLFWIDNQLARPILKNIYLYDMNQSEIFPNTIFVGTNNGLHILKIKGFAKNNHSIGLEKHYKIPDFHDSIRKIEFDSNQNLWLTTEINGIIQIHFADPSLSNYKIYRFGKQEGIETLRDCFACNIHHELILYSNRKLFTALPDANRESGYRINPKTDSWAAYFKQFPQEIYQIHFSDKFGIWANTDKGFGKLLQIGPQQYQLNTYPFKQIKGNVFEFMIDNAGLTWISSFQADGLFVYNPFQEENYRKSFNTPFHSLIRKVTVNFGEITFNGTYYNEQTAPNNHCFLKSSLIQPDTLKKKYPPKTRAIQFHYAVPFFQHSDEICFKYKLSGFDNQWSHWTNKTDKEYINLPPGGYSFTVLAKNMYQFESNPATYSFWITPFWHNTLVARAAFIILLIFIIVFAVFFHFRRVHWAILNERKKYESTFLPAEISEKYVKNLIMLMEIEKPYRNPEITLSKLSELLSIPSYHLSQIINDKKNMNFNEFINSYRINEAIEILNRNNSPKNTMDIAFSVGFNSKSAFYAAFKKHTHMTPTKFRKQLNNVL